MVYAFSVFYGTDSFPQPFTTTTREDFYKGPVVHTGGTAHISGHIQDAPHMSAESEINCPLCSTDMKAWSAVRQKLHLNACCEQAINECPFCPGCNKSFNSKPSRSHLKLCASRLNISILNLMAISERKQRPRFYHSEFTHFVPSTLLAKNDLADDDLRTAVALSLSTEEACKWRRSEAKLANKIHPADFGPPTHLLLTDDQRKAILSDRLSEILLQHSKTGTPSVSDLSWRSSGSESILWHLAGCPIEREANWENLYYVSTLVPPISPTKMAWGENLLSLSQIPGRSIPELCSNHRVNHTDVPDRVHSSAEVACLETQGYSPAAVPEIEFLDSNSLGVHEFLFTSMAGQSLCSDASILLDDEQLIPTHRFVFAAWSILNTVFPNNSSVAAASGINHNELLRLLHILYSGDKSLLRSKWNCLSSSAQNLLKRWGLSDLEPVQPVCTDRFSLVVTDAACTHVIDPQHCDESADCSISCPPDPDDCVRTPVASTIDRKIGTAQFSRDLFASPLETSQNDSDIHFYQEEHTTSTLHGVTPVKAEGFSPDRLDSPKDVIFCDKPTPCPLYKRLRLSVDECNASPSHAKTTLDPPTDVPSVNGALSDLRIETVQSNPPVSLRAAESSSCTSASDSPDSGCRNLRVPSPQSMAAAMSPSLSSLHLNEMITPELKRTLSKYGVRPLPRKRAVALLSEIFRQLQQIEPEVCYSGSPENSKPNAVFNSAGSGVSFDTPERHKSPSAAIVATRVRKGLGQNYRSKMKLRTTSASDASNSTAQSVTLRTNVVHEQCEPAFEIYEDEQPHSTDRNQQVELKAAVLSYLRDDEIMYGNILTYTPLEFDFLHRTLKDTGLRITARQLMDILDEQCIIFTLRNRTRLPVKHKPARVAKSKRYY